VGCFDTVRGILKSRNIWNPGKAGHSGVELILKKVLNFLGKFSEADAEFKRLIDCHGITIGPPVDI